MVSSKQISYITIAVTFWENPTLFRWIIANTAPSYCVGSNRAVKFGGEGVYHRGEHVGLKGYE